MAKEKFTSESVRELIGSAYKPSQKIKDLKIIKNRLMDYRSRIFPPHSQINEVEDAIKHVTQEISDKKILLNIVISFIVAVAVVMFGLIVEYKSPFFK